MSRIMSLTGVAFGLLVLTLTSGYASAGDGVQKSCVQTKDADGSFMMCRVALPQTCDDREVIRVTDEFTEQWAAENKDKTITQHGIIYKQDEAGKDLIDFCAKEYKDGLRVDIYFAPKMNPGEAPLDKGPWIEPVDPKSKSDS